MLPSVNDPETGLKLALTAMMKDTQLDEILLVDYLLFRMNQLKQREYMTYFRLKTPVDDVCAFLLDVARHIGAFYKGNRRLISHVVALNQPSSTQTELEKYDLDAAARFVLQRCREGAFGAFTLDDVSEEGADAFFTRRRQFRMLAKGYSKEIADEEEKLKLLSMTERLASSLIK